jgi:hypothetical protein
MAIQFSRKIEQIDTATLRINDRMVTFSDIREKVVIADQKVVPRTINFWSIDEVFAIYSAESHINFNAIFKNTSSKIFLQELLPNVTQHSLLFVGLNIVCDQNDGVVHDQCQPSTVLCLP